MSAATDNKNGEYLETKSIPPSQRLQIWHTNINKNPLILFVTHMGQMLFLASILVVSAWVEGESVSALQAILPTTRARDSRVACHPR